MQYLNKEKRNKLPLLILLLVLSILLIAIFFLGNKETVDNNIIDIDSLDSINEDIFPYHFIDNNDIDDTYEDGTYIDLNDYDNELVINDGGEYILNGQLSSTLFVDAKDEIVHLFLNNVEIESNNGPAIIINKANKVIITSLEDTINKISDNGNYKNNDEYEACITSYANLVFNGKGRLEVYGLYKDAIRTNDTLKIIGGDYLVEAKKTCLHGTDGIHINGGSLYLASEKNCFKTTKNSNDYRGSIIISGGSLDLIAGNYAFVSNAPLFIFNCSINQKVVSTFNVDNEKYIEQGCINE